MVYYITYFIAALVASGFLVSAMIYAWHNLRDWATAWLIFTFSMFFIHNLANIVEVFGFIRTPNVLSETAINVFKVFDSIAMSLTVFGFRMSAVTAKEI